MTVIQAYIFCKIASGMYLNVPFRHRHVVQEHGEIIAARIMHEGVDPTGIWKMHHLSDDGLGALFVLFLHCARAPLQKRKMVIIHGALDADYSPVVHSRGG